MPKPINQQPEVETPVVETEATEAQAENLVPVRKPKAGKKAKKAAKAAPAPEPKASKKAAKPAAEKADRPERKMNTAIPLSERKQIFLSTLKALGATSATKAITKEAVVAKASGKLFPLDVYRMGRHEMATEGLVGQAKIDGQGLCYFVMAKGLRAIGK